jgi:hypothetical protein
MEKNLTALTKEDFKVLIEERLRQTEKLNDLADLGLDLWDTDIIEYGNKLFDQLLSAYFEEQGSDWIYWWLYDKDGNPDVKSFDSEHNEIPTETLEDLWELVKGYLRY